MESHEDTTKARLLSGTARIKEVTMNKMSNVSLSLAMVMLAGAADAWAVTIASRRINLRFGSTRATVPYERTTALGSHSDATRAVIAIHGADRTAVERFHDMEDAAALAGPTTVSNTIIFAPQFLHRADAVGLTSDVLTWPDGSDYSWNTWKFGLDSNPGPNNVKITSFKLIDLIVQVLLNRTTYPHLSDIVIAGQSAGGQFVNRYAAGNTVETEAELAGVRMRYIVANPSAYLYMDEYRASPRTTGAFRLLTAAERAACSDYNKYYLGLDTLRGYLAGVSAAQIRTQFQQRDVRMQNGVLDSSPCAEGLDNSCGAKWQGRHRLERGLVYYNYVGFYYGSDIYDTHTLDIMPGVGHGSYAAYTSNAGLRNIFDVTLEPNEPVIQIDPITGTTPTFKWYGTHLATAYDVQIKDTAGTVLSTRRYAPADAGCVHGGLCSARSAIRLTRDQTYTWSVRGVYNTGGSDWSTKTIVVSTPAAAVPIAPAGAIDDPTPTYSWQRDPGSYSYNLQISNSSGQVFYGTYDADDACPCGVTPDATLPDRAYYFKVRARNYLGRGPWSPALWFTVDTDSSPAGALATADEGD